LAVALELALGLEVVAVLVGFEQAQVSQLFPVLLIRLL
jgi:hypothetical protein